MRATSGNAVITLSEAELEALKTASALGRDAMEREGVFEDRPDIRTALSRAITKVTSGHAAAKETSFAERDARRRGRG